MKSTDPFPSLLRAFFYEWMVQQRNASVHTVRSYRDTWRLFLRFVADRRRRTVAQLGLADLTASEVSAFLHHTEYQRGDTIGTRTAVSPRCAASSACRWSRAQRDRAVH
jgi:site-specific recombinase XerD